MDITITPQTLNGTLQAIPSKSQAHRLLICSAFADCKTKLICGQTNRDIEATVQCLNAIGASIIKTNIGYVISPIRKIPEKATLNCGESGSTLRFMLPIVGALGIDCLIHMEGRLPDRPLSPLWEEMERMGCMLSKPEEHILHCCGKLLPGKYTIDGSVSSQYITGLMFAISLIDGKCALDITGEIQSKPYLDITRQALEIFGIKDFSQDSKYISPGSVHVEGDWSNCAFFLAANALGNNILVEGLNPHSAQGDKACMALFDNLHDYAQIDAADIPDLVPILSVVAAHNKGAKFTNISRLRLKESDRVVSTEEMLNNLGINTISTENTLTVFPGKFAGGTINSYNDHRIAMAAAIAATVASSPLTIVNAQCVEKSYPIFWKEYQRLGGKYEQYIR